MNWKERIIVICVAIVAIVAAGIVAVVMISGPMGPRADGSVKEASKLKPIVAAIADPESGVGSHPNYGFMRFDNGEWVLGIARDSHGFMAGFDGGGTVVVKDNRGRLRCFFGHVCGPRFLWMEGSGSGSLDEFDNHMGSNFKQVEVP